VACLNISAATAWQRIAGSSGGLQGNLPPFLKTENPQETHRALHERRSAAYLQLADIVVEAEGKTPEKIAFEIHAS
jgi:shikimate kinase